MAEFDGISQYRKCALQRLRDADELLQIPTLRPNESGAETRHDRAAIYLATYAIECIWKAYLISKQRGCMTLAQVLEARRKTGEEIPDILGAKGHDLALLISLTDLEADLGNILARMQDRGICFKWKPHWRYDPTLPNFSASDFVAAVRRVYEWVDRRVLS